MVGDIDVPSDCNALNESAIITASMRRSPSRDEHEQRLLNETPPRAEPDNTKQTAVQASVGIQYTQAEIVLGAPANGLNSTSMQMIDEDLR